ncbi:MAG: type II secretion system protein [Victivallales bacterium]|nr:type II secretion system protein [Victivallales bacterium]
MTLIEIIVVLGIIAAVTSVVLSSAIDFNDREAFERTQRTGQEIQKLFYANDSDDGISRFLSDMGRLPVAYGNDSNALAELYGEDIDPDIHMEILTVDINNHTSDGFDMPSFQMLCGWGGPYIYGNDSIDKDGWGNKWQILNNSGVTTDSWEEYATVYGVASAGSGGDDWSGEEQKFSFGNPAVSSLKVNVYVVERLSGASLVRPVIIDQNATERANNHPYVLDALIAVNDRIYKCVAAGTSASAIPVAWDKTYGATTVDGTVQWQCVAQYMNTLKALFFYPEVVVNASEKERVIESKSTSGSTTNILEFEKLFPGRRKLFVWGYYKIDDDNFINKFHSDVMDVTIRPGTNHVTVYLVNELK